ncbi:assimilatory sulfite reductase (NADPH) flavoprotein subunit [Alkalihalobacillus hwajinpoensis]|uniref:assimilatory sulfite reductase (NADPH) flavoprotein subunit n=1 Tax=Guptibacillus hwajinpoensis TaxID=208199 RepID=UPI0018848760|nr:assimilatory sulfite reductase (NADPH) flavoprotein subunit [Pseudalkalibacillus hwajinpoensis]MBF0707925.1 assimilatory sulfite reductase (NADPH) flavoprotein subunit [Pseudalkalibacillus hwajinpoensis]
MQLQVVNSPFDKEQTELLNRLLPTLNETQKIWLSGYLSVPGSSEAAAATETVAQGVSASEAFSKQEEKTRELTILYGSHTGNCQSLAESFFERLENEKYNVTLSSLDDFKPKSLKKVEDLLLITSTHGDGDPPDNALSFHDFVQSKRAPELDGLRFSVLSLGDSSYEFFCQTGKDFDKRFEELGATRLYPRVDCDLDFEEPAEEWFEGVTGVLKEDQTTGESTSQTKPDETDQAYSRTNPFKAEILENVNLNGRGSNKETRHLELDLEGSNLEYEPGDSLGIYPENDTTLVLQLIEEMNWKREEQVTVNKQGDVHSLEEALTKIYEMTSLTKPLLKKIAELTSSSELKRMVEAEGEELRTYLYGRDLIDLVKDYGPWTVSAQEFVNVLRKIPVRLYSIASSSKANPDEVHLTIGALRYDAHGRSRTGVCSGQCAERSQAGDTLPVFVQRNQNFRLPDHPDTPIIMIGAGTGVAPYRAFLQEREESGASGETWLFFGEQHFVTDFLYQVEWQKWLKDGVLTRMDVAFSRDTEEKVYVQHRMRERSKELYEWLQQGAHVYVCGDEKYMAKDVHVALVNILEQQGNFSESEAEAYLADLRNAKRYQRDVY